MAHGDRNNSNSYYETNFGVCSAYGAANPKIGFLKGSRRLPFKKPISIMRIAISINLKSLQSIAFKYNWVAYSITKFL